jgi:hypothetical protein
MQIAVKMFRAVSAVSLAVLCLIGGAQGAHRAAPHRSGQAAPTCCTTCATVVCQLQHLHVLCSTCNTRALATALASRNSCARHVHRLRAGYSGDLTFYGGAGSGGACTQTLVPPGFKTVAMNAAQYDGGGACGMCISACYNDGSKKCFKVRRGGARPRMQGGMACLCTHCMRAREPVP